MKLTSNATSMLINEYKAILKHAFIADTPEYIKLAKFIILSSSLTIGTAVAATYNLTLDEFKNQYNNTVQTGDIINIEKDILNYNTCL